MASPGVTVSSPADGASSSAGLAKSKSPRLAKPTQRRVTKPRSGDAGKKESKQDLPRCAKDVLSILKAMGIVNHDPRVVPQLLEFCYRYVGDVLEDATRYSEHRTKASEEVKVNKDDLKLAVQARVNFSSSGPPPREFLLEIAKKKNDEPLPLIAADKFGVRLPPERFRLTSPNYRVLPSEKKATDGNAGPWALPYTQSAVDAAKQAKAARQRAKLDEQERNMREQASAAPSSLSAQVGTMPTAPDDGDDDNYD